MNLDQIQWFKNYTANLNSILTTFLQGSNTQITSSYKFQQLLTGNTNLLTIASNTS